MSGGDDKKKKKFPWFTAMLAFIAGGILVWAYIGFKVVEAQNIPGKYSTRRPGVTASTFTTDTVSCPTFSRERRTCAFGTAGTFGIGSDEAGLHFCYSLPYGSRQTYTRYRYADGEWVRWGRYEEPGVIHAQRFVANNEKASVEYWLSEIPCP
ncbi:hypothetical protein KJ819_02775 [Patescibacteria group bacterium]|nr:hypothetical protein [Patescibacteria group bacterium]MBU1500800.1 hypothetical protein [Patescibacteria group bacterium]MBU2080855.1 hypothetical protein [Patescibacteria group bacterium]MBU2123960.1 hypothetical protein [Patescibacteria group bacterium]MBU2194749.1 hypothetical protein [Patescibacteria group bacterium]